MNKVTFHGGEEHEFTLLDVVVAKKAPLAVY